MASRLSSSRSRRAIWTRRLFVDHPARSASAADSKRAEDRADALTAEAEPIGCSVDRRLMSGVRHVIEVAFRPPLAQVARRRPDSIADHTRCPPQSRYRTSRAKELADSALIGRDRQLADVVADASQAAQANTP